jgi:hypothetical protein
MRKFYFACFVFLSIQTATAQFGINAYYQNTIVNMSPSRSIGNGFGMDLFYGSREKPLSLGLSFSRSNYGEKHTSVSIPTYYGEMSRNLRVNNDFTNISIYSRYKLSKINDFILPFVEGKIGWGFLSTRLHFDESADMGGCEPVQQNTVHQDGNWIGYAGAGMDLKLTGIFRKEKEERNVNTYLTLSAGYSAGGKISYFNAEHADASSHQHSSDTESFNAEFINTQTQEVHEHSIGYLYNSNLSMAEFKLGFSLRF